MMTVTALISWEDALSWFFLSKMSVDFSTQPLEGPPVAVLTILALAVYSIIWAALDGRRRGKSPWLSGLFVAMAWWPFSILWWLWLRPAIKYQVSEPNVAPSEAPPLPRQ